MRIKNVAFDVSSRLHKVHEKNYILRMHCPRLHQNNTLCIEIPDLNINMKKKLNYNSFFLAIHISYIIIQFVGKYKKKQ